MVDRIAHPSEWSQTIVSLLGWAALKSHVYHFYKTSSQLYRIIQYAVTKLPYEW